MQKFIVYIALSFAAIFWAISFIWSKAVFEVYNPFTTVLIRLLIAGGMLVLIGLLTGQLQRVDKTNFKPLLLIAFCEPFLYFVGEGLGLSLVSPTVCAVIVSTIPLFSPIVSWFVMKERITVMNYLGIMISVVGVGMVIFKPDMTLVAPVEGILYLSLAIAAAIAYAILVAKIKGKFNIYTTVTYQNVFGILFFLPIFLFSGFQDFIHTVPDTKTIYSLLALAVFPSTFAFIFFAYSVQKIGVTRSNTFINIIPVFTAIFSYFITGEVLTIMNQWGILVTLCGLSLSQINRQRISKLRTVVSHQFYRIRHHENKSKNI